MNADLESLGLPLRDLEREFKEKIEPYRSDLWRYCRTLTRSPWDAEDLVQDTLLRAFSLLPKLYQPIEPKAYLFKIATNRWIDQRRKQERIEMREDMEEINAAGEFDYQLLENLEHLVHILTPVQYVSIILTDAFLYKGKEVAHIIGTTEASVHAHVSRARKSLRKYNPVSNAKSGTSASVDSLQADQVIATMLEGFRSKDPKGSHLSFMKKSRRRLSIQGWRSAWKRQRGIPWRIGIRMSRINKTSSGSTVCYGVPR